MARASIGGRRLRGLLLTAMMATAACTNVAPVAPIMPVARAPDAPKTVYQIKPSATDAAIARHDDAHYVALSPTRDREDSLLLLFMPGTGGAPRELTFFPAMLDAGYRVISLSYIDYDAVQQRCARHPDPDCAAKVRQKRLYGDDVTDAIDDAPADAIVNRLVRLLVYLDRAHPEQKWNRYLDQGKPNWSRIVVTGQSQGAGMAAYIAKEHAVPRVVLFSSPWDSRVPGNALAPWLSRESATPPDRWYGGYHAKENTAVLLGRAYAQLRIPESHIRVWTAEPEQLNGPNPYHGVGISRANSAENFALMFGRGYSAP